MTSTEKRSPPLREVILELAVAKPVPDAEVLDEFTRRYPEYAAELTEAAVDLVLAAAAGRLASEPSGPRPTPSSSVAKGMRRFDERLAELEAKASPLPPVNPFDLEKAEFRALAGRLHANTAFLMKLRDRRVRADTMPEGFRRLVAAELSVPMELLAAHFAGPPQLPRNAYYKSDRRPDASATQSFEEAVRGSALTPEQQAFLLGL